MARGGRGDITVNVSDQLFTSRSPCTHVQGAYGARINCIQRVPLAVPPTAVGACNGRRLGPLSLPHAAFCGGRTQHVTYKAHIIVSEVS